ncbi:MAG: EamA family transporter [Fluviicola sp.]|nr:EamA family transporter [Fluviicola sp.]
MLKKFKYHILMHVIIFMWGFTGILGKLIHLPTLQLVWYRILIAGLAMVIGLKLLGFPMRIPNKKRRFQVLGVGVLVATHWLTFYESIQLSTASLGILCLSTATLHVTWLEPIIFKKQFSWIEFSFGLLVIGGIYFVSSDFDPKQYFALGLGLFSALCAAMFSVFNAKIAEDTPAPAITFHEMIMGFVVITIALAFRGELTAKDLSMTWSDFWWLLFLGIVCTSFAFIATIEVMKRLGAFTVSLSINLEPVYTILLAIPILNEDEILNGNFYAGSAMIILVVVANGIYKGIVSKKRSLS